MTEPLNKLRRRKGGVARIASIYVNNLVHATGLEPYSCQFVKILSERMVPGVPNGADLLISG